MSTSEKSPTADVYAGDTSSPGATETAAVDIHFFCIEADAEPVAFARIANVLTIANIAPHRVTLETNKGNATLNIYMELRVASDTARSIQRKLAQLTDVTQVSIGLLPSQ